MTLSRLYLMPLHFDPQKPTATTRDLPTMIDNRWTSRHLKHHRSFRTSSLSSSSRKQLPLSLGREQLATWWWSSCPCMGTVTRKPCQHNCRRVARHVRALSKHGMIQLSERGRLRVHGKNAMKLIHVNGTSISKLQKHNHCDLQLLSKDVISIGDCRSEQTKRSLRVDADNDVGEEHDDCASCSSLELERKEDDSRRPWMQFQLLEEQQRPVVTPELPFKNTTGSWMTTSHDRLPPRKRARCLFPPLTPVAATNTKHAKKNMSCSDELSEYSRYTMKSPKRRLVMGEHPSDPIIDSDDESPSILQIRYDPRNDKGDAATKSVPTANNKTPTPRHRNRRLYLSPPSAENHRTKRQPLANGNIHMDQETIEQRPSMVTPSFALQFESRKRRIETCNKSPLPSVTTRRRSHESSALVAVDDVKKRSLSYEEYAESPKDPPQQCSQQPQQQHTEKDDDDGRLSTTSDEMERPRQHQHARRRLLVGGIGKKRYLKPSPSTSVKDISVEQSLPDVADDNKQNTSSGCSIPTSIHKPNSLEIHELPISKLTTTNQECRHQGNIHPKDPSSTQDSKHQSNESANRHSLLSQSTVGHIPTIAINAPKMNCDKNSAIRHALSLSTRKLIPPMATSPGNKGLNCQTVNRFKHENIEAPTKDCARSLYRHSLSQSTCELVPNRDALPKLQLHTAKPPLPTGVGPDRDKNTSSPPLMKECPTTAPTADEGEATDGESCDASDKDYSSMLLLPQCHSSEADADSDYVSQKLDVAKGQSPPSLLANEKEDRHQNSLRQLENCDDAGMRLTTLNLGQWRRLAYSTPGNSHDNVPAHMRALACLVVAKNINDADQGASTKLWLPPLIEGTEVQRPIRNQE